MTKLPEPTEIERQEITAAQIRKAARGPRLAAKVVPDKGGRKVISGPTHADARGWCDRLLDVLGTTSADFVSLEIGRVNTALDVKGDISRHVINGVLAVLDGAKPSNEIEAQLVVQMIATHATALDMLGKAKRAEQVYQLDAHGVLANKLLRTYARQVEALVLLRRGGAQVVRVEHVYRKRRKPGEGGGKKEKPPKAPIAALAMEAVG